MITRENKIIRLSWAKADLFQTICTETAYNARTLADDKGLPLFDRYAITADERAFFDQHIAEALTTFGVSFRIVSRWRLRATPAALRSRHVWRTTDGSYTDYPSSTQ